MKKIINHLKDNWVQHGFETFVIIVGILGAFLLNSWNEDRNQRIREIQLLIEMQNGLEGMEKSFSSLLQETVEIQNSRQVIIDVIENEIVWHDSLQQHFNTFLLFYSFKFDMAAYNSLENWGINNLSNDNLRRQIVSLFQNEPTDLQIYFQQEYDIIWLDLRKSTQLDVVNLSGLQPADYGAFIKNEELALELKWLKGLAEYNSLERQRVLERIIELRENINEEIERLRN